VSPVSPDCVDAGDGTLGGAGGMTGSAAAGDGTTSLLEDIEQQTPFSLANS
jgi:hypothetical protein